MIWVMIGGDCNQIPLHFTIHPLPLEIPNRVFAHLFCTSYIKDPIVYRNVRKSVDCNIRICYQEPKLISDLTLRLDLNAYLRPWSPKRNIEYTHVDSWINKYGLIRVFVDIVVRDVSSSTLKQLSFLTLITSIRSVVRTTLIGNRIFCI